MPAATWHADEISGGIRPQGRAAHLFVFAGVCLATSVAWGLVLLLGSRLRVLPATVLFLFQFGILIAAIAIWHGRGSAKRLPLVVLPGLVLVPLSLTSLFSGIGGPVGMAMFIMLTLLLALSPFCASSGRSALLMLFGTLLPWVLSLTKLPIFTHPADLATAIAMSSVVSLVVLESSQLSAWFVFREAVGERGGPDPAPDTDAGSDHPEIAILRQPLQSLREEEVDDLKKELRRLKTEVNRQLDKMNVEAEKVRDDGRRRGNRRSPSPTTADLAARDDQKAPGPPRERRVGKRSRTDQTPESK